ncbi:thermonuclease family protein [Mycoplasmopsis alligatoris]|uniref:Nuclease-like protein n=1 Tax=Mycoplasmopsis alligatoris A21JP2 TaxID=747682 RepID=D4XVB1_9BACT|nr:thermonuclease family protein [Mycoplasmopsis alligatoris]EFF41678.1 nuclease-like protein [Mycoplasmopsis alligatoris A21JP2]
MKKIYLLLLIFGSLFFVSCQKQISPNTTLNTKNKFYNEPQKELIKVLEVYDGDTLLAIKNDKQIKIRLYGLDTPETLKETNKNYLAKLENIYALKAKEYLSFLVQNTNFELFLQQISTDHYGRIVGVLSDLYGTNINLKIVENGYGIVYYINNKKNSKYFSTKNKYQENFYYQLIKAQNLARLDHIQIWQEKYLSDVFYKRTNINFD